MKPNIPMPLQAFAMALPLCFLTLCFLNVAAAGQESRQAICQSSMDMCLSKAEGKNWKPVYDRCVKARTICLGGQAYVPVAPATPASYLPRGSGLVQDFGSGRDPANADPDTRAAACENGQPRGTHESCKLAEAHDGYGQNFSLVGPGVPMSRIQRVSSVVKCAGGTLALFYPNGRIESCVLDNSGSQTISLTGDSGKVMSCAARNVARFDPEGRVLSCSPF
jgi:hypothetical protein